MSSNTNTKSSAAVKPKTPIRAPFKMKPSRPLKSKSTKSQGAEADPGQAAVVLPAKDTESPKSQATKGLQGPDGPKALDGTKTPERVKGRDGVKTPDSVKGPKGVGDSTASKGEETDTSQAEHTEDAIKVTPKATEKKNKSKPFPTRVSKPRTSKEVAKGKLSHPVAPKGKFSVGKSSVSKTAGKTTAKVVIKAAGAAKKPIKKPHGPRNVYHEGLGEYGLEYEVEAIVDSKVKKGKRYYLVKWVGWPESDNTWEPEINLSNADDLITIFDIAFPDKP